MPIAIDKYDADERIDFICENEWELPTQIVMLEK
jgi:hypothetical protein